MTEPTVSAGYARALFDMAVARGADVAALARSTGLEPATLDDPDQRIGFDRFKNLMRAASQALGDPAFALHFGAESDFADMSIVGLICHSAPTMGAAFYEMNRFARLVIEVDGHDVGDRFALLEADGDLWLEDQRRRPNDFPELTESTFARFICETRRYFGPVPFAREVHFTHAEPAHSAEIERILGVPVHFGRPHNAIAIYESWLSIPIDKPNRYVFGILSERAEALLAALEQDSSMRAKVERAIIPALHTGTTNMAGIARELGVSRMTLYRRLKDEGVTFDQLLGELRQKMALHYIGANRTSMNEVAYLVGFSDPASFSRAFKRWTGSPPSQFMAQTEGKNHLGKT